MNDNIEKLHMVTLLKDRQIYPPKITKELNFIHCLPNRNIVGMISKVATIKVEGNVVGVR